VKPHEAEREAAIDKNSLSPAQWTVVGGLVYHIPAGRVHIFHGRYGPGSLHRGRPLVPGADAIQEVDLGASGRVIFLYVAKVTAYHLTDEGST